MTKKHYEAIAAIIKRQMKFTDCPGEIENVAANLAIFLRTQNPKFDRDKFLKACGL